MLQIHDNFKIKITNRYGTVWSKKVNEFTRLRIKRNKLECGLEYVVKCRDSGVIPKFLRIKPIKCIRDYDKFFRIASEKLLRRVISEYRQKLLCTNKKVFDLHLQLSQKLSQELWEVLDTMSFSRSHALTLQIKQRHDRKLKSLIQQQRAIYAGDYPRNTLNNESNNNNTDNTQRNHKVVVNLSSCHLDDNSYSVLSRGLNYAPTPKRMPVEKIITGIEDTIVRNKIPFNDAECMRQDISTMLRKSKVPQPNITRGELTALREIRNNENVLVLPADKGNATVVVDTDTYESKITHMVSDTRIYKKVKYNPTLRVSTKVVQLVKSLPDIELQARLRPHNPTPPKIYGLPKVHKPDWPLRPIVSQIDAPTYKLSKHLASILQQYTGKTDTFVKDSYHFVQLLEDIRIQPSEIMVSFDIASLFTSVPVDETMNIIKTIIQGSDLPTEYIHCIDYCLKSGYFMWRGEYFLQVDGVAMGSPIAPVVANIFMEWFENTALNAAVVRPRVWLRYVDDIFAVITKDGLAGFADHLNQVHRNIAVTVEEESDGTLSFLDVRVIRRPDGSLAHTVYRKPTHTERYLHANSHHHPAHLSSVPRALINRALRICDPQYLDGELNHVRGVLEDNGYSWRQCGRWCKQSERKRPQVADRSPAYLPFVKGVTDRIGYLLRRKYDVKTIFRPPGHLRQMLRSPKDKDELNVPGVYRIPCDCGKSYVGETRRNITTRLTEHIRSIKNSDTTRSAIAEHAHLADTNHFIRFDKASVLAREKFFVPRKVREAIEINRHPNFNRDSGWTLPSAWKPILNASSKKKVSVSLECDTVSIVCDGTSGDRSSSDEEPTMTSFGLSQASSVPKRNSRYRSPPSPPPPRLSSRAQRAAARSEHRDLTA